MGSTLELRCVRCVRCVACVILTQGLALRCVSYVRCVRCVRCVVKETAPKRATAVCVRRLVFATSTLFDAPLAEERLANAVYVSLKSTFSGLQFRRSHCGSIFIRLAVVASQSREITRKSDKI